MGKANSRKHDRRRTIPLEAETTAVMRDQLARFRQRFGRDPGPDDPVFFDPDQDNPTPISADEANREIVQAMVSAGIPPELIYAYKKTGLIRTETTEDKLLPEDRAASDEAIGNTIG
jgi:hypothetical protein